MSTRTSLLKLTLGICLALSTSIGAWSQPSAEGVGLAAASIPSADQTYILGSQDVIEVALLGARGFKVRERIKPDGTIQVPLLMSVAAANKTTLELRDEIGRALESGGFVINPLVEVIIVSPARSIIVLGAVANPGLIPVDRLYRLSEILARVGGVRDNGADYVILRPEKGAERRLSIQALATGDASEDPLVSAGDKIFIPRSEVFYISGQIKAPGAYPLSSDMTLRMAIAQGGGLTDIGSESRIRVTRRNVELDRLDLNSKIEPSDVIVVGQSFF